MSWRILETKAQVDAVNDPATRKPFLIIAAVLGLVVPFLMGGWGFLWTVLLAGAILAIPIVVAIVVLRLVFR